MAIDMLAGDLAPVPWDLVLVNIIGSAALGFLTPRLAQGGAHWWAPMLTTGALGGFTTFSALAGLRWTADAPVGWAVAALVGTMAACVVAAAAGWRLGTAGPGARRAAAAGTVNEDVR